MGKAQFKVLLADDEHWVCENLRGLLQWQDYGYELLPSATDGEDALQKVRQLQPDILITDINMPFLSGIELLQRVREESPHTAVIVLSGYDDFKYVREALRTGALDYLRKPVSRSDLLKVLEEASRQVDHSREEALQQQRNSKQIHMASSMREDHDMSIILHAGRRDSLRKEVVPKLFDLDRQFMNFTLVMFRVVNPSVVLQQKQNSDAGEVIFAIKKIMQDRLTEGNGLVFHDVYRPEFYFMLTDLAGDTLESVCKRLVIDLGAFTGYSINVLLSRQYFSLLSSFSDAYRDCLIAYVLQLFTSSSTILHVEQVEGVQVHERLTSELEKQMLVALDTGNKKQFQQLALQTTGLCTCQRDQWVFREVQQTVNAIAWILRSHLSEDLQADLRVQLDHLYDDLMHAVGQFDDQKMCDILSRMIELSFSITSVQAGVTIHDIVSQVRSYIDQNYFENITLPDLARRFSVDATYLSRVFKQDTGVNLMMYIAKHRVNRAKELLSEQALSITEIAQMVGYSDYAYFSRVFRKMEGISPRAYREGGNRA